MDTRTATVSLHLGNKDEDLKRWFELISENGLEQSFYIKQAILAHIDGEKIDLGAVMPLGSTPQKRTTFSVSSQETKILDLIDNLEDVGLMVSTYFKRVLRMYISTVRNAEDEYIPEYFEVRYIEPVSASSELANFKIADSQNEEIRTKKQETKENDTEKAAKTQESSLPESLRKYEIKKEDLTSEEIEEIEESKEKSKAPRNPLVDEFI